jgi:hypothetical protein
MTTNRRQNISTWCDPRLVTLRSLWLWVAHGRQGKIHLVTFDHIFLWLGLVILAALCFDPVMAPPNATRFIPPSRTTMTPPFKWSTLLAVLGGMVIVVTPVGTATSYILIAATRRMMSSVMFTGSLTPGRLLLTAVSQAAAPAYLPSVRSVLSQHSSGKSTVAFLCAGLYWPTSWLHACI